MTPDHKSRLLDLFVAWTQATITEAEDRELQAALRTDVEARRLWFLHQDLELGLQCLTQVVKETADHQGEGVSVSKGAANADLEPGSRLSTSSANWSRVARLARRHPAMTAVALLCLSATVLFGVHMWRLPPSDFMVESPTHGTNFALSGQKGKVIALHFLLKTECPFCLKLTNDYARLGASEPDVVHLFLKPDSADEIKVWAGKISQEGLKSPPVIYRDPDARLAKEYGIPGGYEFHGSITHYPALVLLDGSGQEVFRYVGKNNSDRMKPDDFITRLAMVTDHK
ncbi:MAG: Redoxin domain protein [Schlesneria sp.]|nr:Redoxin domain protein [Schlesneria sp.]